MRTPDDLIQRLTDATGPDRELDKAVYAAMGHCNHERTEYYCIEDGNDTDSGFTCLDCGKDTYGAKSAPLYTASIDAALTLVPEGSEWELTTLYGVARAAVDLNAVNGAAYGENQCGLPALALLIAALKAGGNDAE